MQFTMTIKLDNSAMKEDEYGPNPHRHSGPALSDVISGQLERIWDGQIFGYVMDVNGNTIGEWKIS